MILPRRRGLERGGLKLGDKSIVSAVRVDARLGIAAVTVIRGRSVTNSPVSGVNPGHPSRDPTLPIPKSADRVRLKN